MKEAAKRRKGTTNEVEEITEKSQVTEVKRRRHPKKKSAVTISNVAVQSSEIKAGA